MAEKIGQLLLREKLIDEMNLESALSESRSTGMRLGEFLIKHRGFEEEKLYFTLSKQFSIPFIKNIKDEINYDILKELPIELFRKNRCLPLYRNEQFLGVIVSDPLDLDIMMELECVTGLIVETSLAMPSEMETVCKELFKDESFFKDSVGKISREYEKQLQHEDAQLSLEEIRKNIESEPVVKMVSLIFDEAIGQRASDIHIEPSDGNAIIRFRVDGMLRQYMELTKWMYSPLTSRIKILAELDIAEKRVPQDGRIRYSCKNQVYDFRISTLPTHHGEKTVIRILKHDLSLLELENLGIEKQELDLLHEAIEKPQGMIFVTGPTGSGKSSTLFACLNRIKRKEINITTIENPIEYKLDGINQVQINEKAGVTFATTLRSILRQDPDVILVGEIRDKETAEIAIQASQTGHLVLSTLHTNDSVSAI
jgi:type IV pilus assembly protein PilB